MRTISGVVAEFAGVIKAPLMSLAGYYSMEEWVVLVRYYSVPGLANAE
jgi:hypothetical protein